MIKSGFSYLKLTAVVAVLAINLIGLSGLSSLPAELRNPFRQLVVRRVAIHLMFFRLFLRRRFMLCQQLQTLLYRARLQGFLFFCALIAINLWSPAVAVGQYQLVGVCPAACGIKIHITSATLTEANDGMLVNVEWTLEQTAPEIKLKNLTVFARVKLGIDKVENTVNVSSTARKVTFKLSRLLEFDFKDVEVLTTKVTAIADALPRIPVTNIASRKIVGEGRDSAVEVTWGDPGPLSCSANLFEVSVAATNEKGDRLIGNTTRLLSARTATEDVKGVLNKKGLHNPEATINVINNPIECVELQNFPPKQTPVGGGVGSLSSSNSKVTLTNLSLIKESPERVNATVKWEVAEPAGFKATGFALRLDVEDASGKISTSTLNFNGNQRSFEGGGIASPGNLRSVTATITATFKDNANTIVLTREDKKTQPFIVKQVVKPE